MGWLPCSNEPGGYAGWSSQGPGRVTVMPDRSKVRGQTKNNLMVLQVGSFA